MKRIITILPILVCLAGVGIIARFAVESRNQKQKPDATKAESLPVAAPISNTYSAEDQQLVQQVFDTPRQLDGQTEPTGAKPVDQADLASRPALMSAQQTKLVHREPQAETKAMQSSSLIESFASLRTDAVRNPESEQNQTAVKSIMKKRQRRVAELEQRRMVD